MKVTPLSRSSPTCKSVRLGLPCPGVVPFRIVYGGEQTTGREEVLNFIVFRRKGLAFPVARKKLRVEPAPLKRRCNRGQPHRTTLLGFPLQRFHSANPAHKVTKLVLGRLRTQLLSGYNTWTALPTPTPKNLRYKKLVGGYCK